MVGKMLVAALAVLAVAGCTPAAPVTEAADWVGSWAVAAQSGGRSFGRQTVRQVLRTSIGGSTVRLRLSNEFGDAPLTLANVRLALSEGDAAIDASTSTAVTFGGAATATMAAGASLESDPVAFALPASADVAVSAYLPGGSKATTWHSFANRHNYVGADDQTADATLTGAETVDSYFFLSGLDVRDPSAEGAVVALGASITDGFDSAFGAGRRWPDLLARRLGTAGRTVGVLNAGISGNKLLRDGAGESVPKRLERDVLSQPGVRWVVLSDAAINDLGDDSPSGEQLITALRAVIDRSHDAGVRVLCSTLTPFKGADYWSTRGEAGREAVNAFLRGASSGCDGVIDLDAATHDPDDPARYLARYDSGDHLHPDDAGMRAIAEAVDLSLLR
ncbi:SGNH/GDSL hydrolase family protein [Actinoplanes sp. NPDC048988]|uniref:SGNH/GDSL hydrolase family protein n=1 Tax=Actinoplanes sp. NPDC048988 TaxID=3363901 RepID=UPI00371C942E